MSTEKLVKAQDVAEAIAVNPETIYRMARAGEIPYFKVHNQIRFDLSAVLKALENNSQDNG